MARVQRAGWPLLWCGSIIQIIERECLVVSAKSQHVRCKPGYTAASGKSSVVTCLINTTWSADSEFCIRKQCSVPQIENGKVIADNFQFETTVKFICDAEYKLKGSSSATCVISGNGVGWDMAFPSCEIIPCLPPPGIANGQLNAENGDFTFGSAVTYSCHHGFSLIGESTIYCTSEDKLNGIWSGPAPECKGKQCSVPQIENGKVIADNFQFETTVKFICDAEEEAAWGRADASLPPWPPGDCGSPPRFPFAEPPLPLNDSYPPGTQLRYRCRPGYTAASGKSPYVTCLPDTTWSAESDFCIGKLCDPPDIQHGKFDYTTDLRFGAVINFTCNEGYRLIGGSSAQCILKDNDVTWSQLPICERQPPAVFCGLPPAIDNGKHNGTTESNFAYGSVVVYKCNDGFTLTGEASIHCTVEDQSHGVWSKPTPECKGTASKIIAGILPLLLAMLVIHF
nr:PREDICTED: complement receptor type 1-like [Apteryx mantelli mantelli]